MAYKILIYTAGAVAIFWGVAHLFPTKNVVRAFGDISDDNKRIITMEWIMEGASLIFLGAVVMAVTIADPYSDAARYVYIVSVVALCSFTLISFFTGFRVNFLPFKLCPFIFTFSAILILIGARILY